MHEWPLFIFTLLMHAAIGGVLVSFVCYWQLAPSFTPNQRAQMLRTPLLFSFILSLLGLLASFFHIGNAAHIFNVIMNVSSSWMSREVLLTGAFVGLLFINVFWVMGKKAVSTGLLALCVLVGLIAAYGMIMLYASTQFTLWSSSFTCGQFYGAVFLLGGVVGGTTLLSALQGGKNTQACETVVRTSFACCMVGLVLLLLSALSLLMLAGQPLSIGVVEKTLPQGLFGLNVVRIGLIALGLFVMGRVLFSSAEKKNSSAAVMMMGVSALCVFVGESFGRYVFFMLGA